MRYASEVANAIVGPIAVYMVDTVWQFAMHDHPCQPMCEHYLSTMPDLAVSALVDATSLHIHPAAICPFLPEELASYGVVVDCLGCNKVHLYLSGVCVSHRMNLIVGYLHSDKGDGKRGYEFRDSVASLAVIYSNRQHAIHNAKGARKNGFCYFLIK